MKNGRTAWTTRCGREVLSRVKAAVDARSKTDRDIYDEHNLDRFARFPTFVHWCIARRKDREERKTVTGFGFNQLEASAASSQPSAEELSSASSAPSAVNGGGEGIQATAPISPDLVKLAIADCVLGIREAMASGRVGKLDVGKALRSLTSLSELWLAENVDRRAEELHELKLIELRKKQDAALDTMANANQLTAEQVAEIRAKVLGL